MPGFNKHLVVFFFCLLPFFAFGEAPLPAGGLQLELGGRAAPNAIGGGIGIQWYTSSTIAAQVGFSFIATDALEDYFGGMYMNLRLDAPGRTSPFVGVGIFSGYSEEYTSASSDGIDNNHDGFVDEVGEEKEVLDNILFTLHPMVGFKLAIGNNTMLTLTSKYHMTSQSRQNDFWMYEMGYLILIK